MTRWPEPAQPAQGLAHALALGGQTVDVVHTHISTVLLCGPDAYKLKKPVKLPFLDFSTVALRRHFCEEECRLNRRTAPALYLEVLPVLPSADGCVLGRAGDAQDEARAVDWALHMRRFSQDGVFANLAQQGRLNGDWVDQWAEHVAQFHQLAPPMPDGWTPRKDLTAWLLESLDEIAAHPARPEVADVAAGQALTDCFVKALHRLANWMAQRRQQGMVREVHGDLHLGNVVCHEGQVMAFDAIEFDPDLRCIDVMNDVAFGFMDLLAAGLPALAWRFVNRYVELTGDFDGLQGLRLFAAYRAVVRAKMALLSGSDPEVFARYSGLAQMLMAPAPASGVLLTMGLSGSGKSTVAGLAIEALAEQGVGAVRVRSDVERKRLFGVSLTDRSGHQKDLYGPRANALTYERLQAVAHTVVNAGCWVVVDAAFLRQHEREAMQDLSQQWGVFFAVLPCVAPDALARARLQARMAQGQDASDATPAVLDQQYAYHEAVLEAWADRVFTVINDGDLDRLRGRVQGVALAVLTRAASNQGFSGEPPAAPDGRPG